jgi:hypothetical protein
MWFLEILPTAVVKNNVVTSLEIALVICNSQIPVFDLFKVHTALVFNMLLECATTTAIFGQFSDAAALNICKQALNGCKHILN